MIILPIKCVPICTSAMHACSFQSPLCIGGCRAQGEPGYGGLSTYETFILWLKFDSLSLIFIISRKVYPDLAPVCPGLQPPMPLCMAAYNCTYMLTMFCRYDGVHYVLHGAKTHLLSLKMMNLCIPVLSVRVFSSFTPIAKARVMPSLVGKKVLCVYGRSAQTPGRTELCIYCTLSIVYTYCT